MPLETTDESNKQHRRQVILKQFIDAIYLWDLSKYKAYILSSKLTKIQAKYSLKIFYTHVMYIVEDYKGLKWFSNLYILYFKAGMGHERIFPCGELL